MLSHLQNYPAPERPRGAGVGVLPDFGCESVFSGCSGGYSRFLDKKKHRAHQITNAPDKKLRLTYVTRRMSCSAASESSPNIRCVKTFAWPRTRTCLPPKLSLSWLFTRSAEERWL